MPMKLCADIGRKIRAIPQNSRVWSRPIPHSVDSRSDFSEKSRKYLTRAPKLLQADKIRMSSHNTIMVATSEADSEALVTAEWLHDRLHNEDIVVLDGSWYMPNAGRDPMVEFCQERIPRSKFFDLDKISDTSSSLPHMLPSPEGFAAAVGQLDIQNSSHVVIYDRAGIFSAPRVWFTFKAFGHKKVAVLDGGYPAWKSAGYDIDQQPVDKETVSAAATAASSPTTSQYKPTKQEQLVRDLNQMLQNVDSKREVVVDARGAARFRGTAPEPRKGIRGGHIPGSLNVPFDSLLANGKYKSRADIQKAFEEAGVKWDQDLVTSCGTGVTAGVLAFGIHLVKPNQSVAVYDGSWTEWGSREETPIETSQG